MVTGKKIHSFFVYTYLGWKQRCGALDVIRADHISVPPLISTPTSMQTSKADHLLLIHSFFCHFHYNWNIKYNVFFVFGMGKKSFCFLLLGKKRFLFHFERENLFHGFSGGFFRRVNLFLLFFRRVLKSKYVFIPKF